MQSHTMYLENHHRSRHELMCQAKADRLARLARETAPDRRRRPGVWILGRIRRRGTSAVVPALRPRVT